MRIRAIAFHIIFLGLFSGIVVCQNSEDMNFGVAFGYGSADGRLLGSDTYFYDYNAFKLVLNKRLLGKSSWRLEGILEPTYFQVKFREIEAATDQSVMQYINEYALVLGLLSRWYLSSSLSAYFVGSTGPLYNDHFTSRMKKGLGFSNGLGIGLTYELKGLRIDIRSGIRHVSNAGLNEPNLGYNSSITEIGLLFALDKRPKVTSTLASQ